VLSGETRAAGRVIDEQLATSYWQLVWLAVAGTMGGRRQKKKAEKEAEQQQQQAQQSQQAQAQDNLKRAYSACMEARNYTVK
jgi:hypothetical protein